MESADRPGIVFRFHPHEAGDAGRQQPFFLSGGIVCPGVGLQRGDFFIQRLMKKHQGRSHAESDGRLCYNDRYRQEAFTF